MAYLVQRDGSYEIRESTATARGPRSRTLATFRVFDDEVLERAAARARHALDRAALRRRAVELDVPTRQVSVGDRLARELLAAIDRGHEPGPALAAALRDRLPAGGSTPDTVAPALEWIGSTPAARGRALRDLLRLTDRLPRPPRARELEFPRISSRAHR